MVACRGFPYDCGYDALLGYGVPASGPALNPTGDPVPTTDASGHYVICVGERVFYVHRLRALLYGAPLVGEPLPPPEGGGFKPEEHAVAFANGDPWDDRASNLRLTEARETDADVAARAAGVGGASASAAAAAAAAAVRST